MNLAPKPPTLAFSIAGIPPRVDWEPEPVQGIDAEAALRGPSAEEPDHRSERDEAASFLREELADGPRGAQELKAAARNIGIAERTLMRAKHDLGIAAVRRGGLGHAGRWEWELAKAARFALGSHPNVMDALGEVGTLSDGDPMLRAAAEVCGPSS